MAGGNHGASGGGTSTSTFGSAADRRLGDRRRLSVLVDEIGDGHAGGRLDALRAKGRRTSASTAIERLEIVGDVDVRAELVEIGRSLVSANAGARPTPRRPGRAAGSRPRR